MRENQINKKNIINLVVLFLSCITRIVVDFSRKAPSKTYISLGIATVLGCGLIGILIF